MTDAIDHANADPSVRPQDDLFRHVNGTWLATAKIDPDKSSAGGFMDLRDAAEQDVLDIIESLPASAPDSDEGRIGALYRSFMDEDRIEVMMPRSCSAAVVTAMRAAHPYEEPAFHVLNTAAQTGGWR